MTRNVKVLIIVLSLVIAGLISFIIGNAIINYLKANSKIYFAKLGSINGNPAYLVNVEESIAGGDYLNLVTYKDGKVITSKTAVAGEYSILKADLNNGIIEVRNDSGEEHVYTIENNEFREFAKVKGYIEKCVEIKTELTNKNIDTYVK